MGSWTGISCWASHAVLQVSASQGSCQMRRAARMQPAATPPATSQSAGRTPQSASPSPWACRCRSWHTRPAASRATLTELCTGSGSWGRDHGRLFCARVSMHAHSHSVRALFEGQVVERGSLGDSLCCCSAVVAWVLARSPAVPVFVDCAGMPCRTPWWILTLASARSSTICGAQQPRQRSSSTAGWRPSLSPSRQHSPRASSPCRTLACC